MHLKEYYSDDALDKEEKVKGRMQRSSGLLMRTLCLCHQPRFLDTGWRGRADCLNSTDLLVIKICSSCKTQQGKGAVAPRQGVVSAIFYSVSITAMHAFAGDPLRASSLTILSVILGFPRYLICLAIKGDSGSLDEELKKSSFDRRFNFQVRLCATAAGTEASNI